MSGAALEAIAVARHHDGDYAAAMDAYEQAHAAYRDEGDRLAAARAARTVGWFRGWVFGEWAVQRGWMARASRLLSEAPPTSRVQGWLLLDDAHAGTAIDAQRDQYEAVIALARRNDDRDLECEALASLGIMLVFSGHVDDGMRHLDETLAALCAGDIEDLSVLEGCLCGLFNACERTHDVQRAEQWLRAADHLINRRKLVAVAGYCRAHYAGILIAAGRWAEADTELTNLLGCLPADVAAADAARCRLADLRVRQGRFEAAEQMLAALDHCEDALTPRVALHLARGDAEPALELVERQLSAPSVEDHVAAPLLAAAVDAHVMLGAAAAAAASSARLTDLARHQSSPYVHAVAAMARARECELRDDGDPRAELHRAGSLFAQVGMPFDVARVRLELARTLAADRPRAAITEASGAHTMFRQLGASHHADRAAALLRTLGAPARTGPKDRTVLTRREREVLELLGHGLSNAALAERLFISPKTVEHHVGRILSKLGLRNRAEAAAYAARAG